ncbi:MAG: hypothetical protein ACFE0J_17460 [Elainellaceae cyanobacterium]
MGKLAGLKIKKKSQKTSSGQMNLWEQCDRRYGKAEREKSPVVLTSLLDLGDRPNQASIFSRIQRRTSSASTLISLQYLLFD